MKKTLLILAILFVTANLFAQTRKLEITCEVTEGYIDYGNLSKFLPDSIRQSVLVQLKTFNTLNDVGVINLLTLHGWKVIGFSNEVGSFSRQVDSKKVYVLKRDIEVSDEEYKAILSRMNEYRKR
jgi:hypothetical protein